MLIRSLIEVVSVFELFGDSSQGGNRCIKNSQMRATNQSPLRQANKVVSKPVALKVIPKTSTDDSHLEEF
jgi:hypothetical protein